MKLKAISRKGNNRVKEGLGTEVVVLMRSHPSNPPAILVAPVGEPSMNSKFVRWVKLQDDPDFEILE